jgi:DNA-binding MarR family transcriptional regulator
MEELSAKVRSRTPVEWSDLELTMPQVRTLFLLRDGPRRMREVSDHLGRGMPAATSMMGRLVSKGLVERSDDASDRRVVSCRLTALGEDTVERFWKIGHARLQELTDVLSPDELSKVVPAMVVLVEAAARLSDLATPAEGQGDGEKNSAAASA